MSASAVRLNHAVLFVCDVERSIDFYSRALGMSVVARADLRELTPVGVSSAQDTRPEHSPTTS